MIIIVDNGKRYSEHSIYFFEGTNEECDAIAKEFHRDRHQPTLNDDDIPFVVGTSSTIEWVKERGENIPAHKIHEYLGWVCMCGRFNRTYDSECVRCDKPQPGTVKP